MTSAEISIIPEFKEKIELLEVPQDFDIKQRSVENIRTGVDIVFRGIKTSSGNQTASLKSIQGITTWILEEGEELKNEEDFDTIDLSIRAKAAQNRVIIIMNPTTKDHWVYRRFFENHLSYIDIDGERITVTNHPDVLHIHTTYLDNIEHLSDTFIKQVKRVKTENYKKYIHKILGGWLEKAEGVVFENWQDGAFDESLPFCYGLDFGFFPDPLAMTKVAIDRKLKYIYLKEVMYELKLSTGQVLSKIQGSLSDRRSLIISDTNEPRLKVEIKKAGFNIEGAAKGAGSIIRDIRDMQDYTLIIDPGSYNLKKELNNYAWNDRKASIPIDDHNHLIDAARYGFRKLSGTKKKGIKRIN